MAHSNSYDTKSDFPERNETMLVTFFLASSALYSKNVGKTLCSSKGGHLITLVGC